MGQILSWYTVVWLYWVLPIYACWGSGPLVSEIITNPLFTRPLDITHYTGLWISSGPPLLYAREQCLQWKVHFEGGLHGTRCTNSILLGGGRVQSSSDTPVLWGIGRERCLGRGLRRCILIWFLSDAASASVPAISLQNPEGEMMVLTLAAFAQGESPLGCSS